ncbi:NAD-dependent epimerase/dehydratase family protein [Paramuribaculum intestinale]|uniref:NAD-dependent epimerase/dehydratase family protein n=1 Tax=Paramuribaculum intestinale TaxID=2094151 RepID=UPI000FFE672E|nr:NAD-dependent epimerase/dehydratase family protein [Paramuribaculum intestinale]RXE61357.1 NAD-dependent epimerase/dehydratase family protein [Muribaculaceae bacterium Isolate-004 (NCI)]
MKITMIGASGFIGTRLLGLLAEEASQYEVKNIDLQPSHFFNDVTVIGDVRNQQEIDEGLKGADVVVLLAAQHRDDISPVSLYYDTNVGGMEVTLKAMEKNGCKRIIFFSSVAVYGLNKKNPDENHPADPFNHYGKSKWQAEQVLQRWYESHTDWNINIIRPTVVFGERNRGNVYNLLKQISSGKFLMVGKGENKKSMAYVGNIVAFVKFLIDNVSDGYNVYNYIDKPDNNMNQLVAHVSNVLGKHIPATHFPYWLGMLGGYGFDLLAKITGKKMTVSSVRVKKFCATTEFDATKVHTSGFHAPYTLDEGLARTLEFEFVHPRTDDITFKTE